MSDMTEKKRQELEAAQHALAEVQARCAYLEAERRGNAMEPASKYNTLSVIPENFKAEYHKIEHAHQEWMAALDAVDDPIFLHDQQFRVLRCNRAYQQCAGIPYEQIIGRPYYGIFPKADTPQACCLQEMQGRIHADDEIIAGDKVYHLRVSVLRDEQGAYLYSVHVLNDITDIRRSAAILHESEEKFRKITESAQDAIIMMGADKRISFWNTAAERIFGYTVEEALGQEIHPLIAPPDAQSAFNHGYLHFQENGEGPIVGKVVEVTALRKGGGSFPAELAVSATNFGGQWHAIGIVRDITERKRLSEELRHKSVELEDAQRISHTGNWVLDVETGAVTWSEELYRIFGRDPALPVPDIDKHAQMLTPESLIRMNSAIENTLQTGEPYEIDLELVRPDGATRWITARGEVSRNDAGRNATLRGTAIDITERKQVEAIIQHANRALATLSEVNRQLVYATDEDALLQAICDAIVEQPAYRLVWVGYMQPDERKSIRIMAHAGDDEGYLDALQLTWSEPGPGTGASGYITCSGAKQVCQDIASDPLCSQWRDAALQRGYASSIALPLLKRNDTVFGILKVYAGEVNAFSPDEILLLEEMAGDMAFGVRSLRIRGERDAALAQNQQQLEQLKNSLEDTVRAIAGMVEMRDPYTAGHQARVADLALAIARQMGLPDEQAHGIHLAGVVHDLGKIRIPAEILSKPGRITEIEFSLIKIHSQAGYDILKGIDFPWPIAQMVLQHHERLDGSGYPQGLKGDAILLEARILIVADVVEAMSSHRPYRAGLGIDVALEEITRQRGIYFDPAVVDACLALFREKHYVLPK